MKNSQVKSTKKKNNSRLQPLLQEELGGVSPSIDNIDQLISSKISTLSETISDLIW